MPLPLSVLSGFLGSGKTTLLNRLLTQASARDTAVLINEFGSVGIDHHIVSEIADDVVLLDSGCLCCKAEEDIGSALAALLQRRTDGTVPSFNRVILETSGLADPALVLQRFLSDETLAPRVRVSGIVTVVDAVFGPRTLEHHAECGNQIAMASRIAISKADLIEPSELLSVSALIRSVNPLAPLLTLELGAPLPDSLFGSDGDGEGVSFAATPLRAMSLPAKHGTRYQTFCLQWTEPISWTDFESWIEGLLAARGESLLRIKGLLHIEGCDKPVVVQAVQHALYRPTLLQQWPHDERGSELVFITKDFSSVAAVNSFKQLFPCPVSVR